MLPGRATALVRPEIMLLCYYDLARKEPLRSLMSLSGGSQTNVYRQNTEEGVWGKRLLHRGDNPDC